MKKKFFVPLLFILCLNPFAKGQTSSLGIDTGNYNIPASVVYNTSYTFSVNVKNYGPQPFNGSLDIAYAVDSSSTFPMYDTMLTAHIVTMNISVNGEQPDSNTIPIDGKFKSGINTVVIWPRSSPNNTTHDSLKVSVLVTGTLAGLSNYTQPKPIIFPNPTQGRLFIANRDPNFTIEQVRIYDITGQLIYTEPFKGSMDVSRLACGVYTMEFYNKTGNTTRYKVIKE